ncbi:hypothetical protein [Pseudomonas sp. MAG002Y]|uniref:hypothetical protein n=1 Tax=Pseudomonas sp. MAG002Y TaxID=2678690 RepID=UPI001C608F91|nr:hypothetical protein [Pseudomonas sp. MAG002Y]MBW5415865.1 hypothetical protein [Pseudomonas sp. MAG002Y]
MLNSNTTSIDALSETSSCDLCAGIGRLPTSDPVERSPDTAPCPLCLAAGRIAPSMPLKCYRLGEHDYFAAESAAQAMALMRELVGDDDWDYEVEEVTDAYLDKEWGGEDTPDEVCGTLRQWLSDATEPQWIAGTE